MNKDQMRRVRELQERIDEREGERRMTLRRDALTNADRDAAIVVATWTGMLGSVPSVVWSIVSSVRSDWTGVFQVIFGSLCFIVPFVLIAAAAGTFSGLFAHWWFADSGVPVKRAAIAVALLSDAVLFGWVIVLSR